MFKFFVFTLVTTLFLFGGAGAWAQTQSRNIESYDYEDTTESTTKEAVLEEIEEIPPVSSTNQARIKSRKARKKTAEYNNNQFYRKKSGKPDDPERLFNNLPRRR